MPNLTRYDRSRSYDWNYQHAPPPAEVAAPPVPGDWRFCGRSVGSPLGVAAGPLLNGAWCLYYASLGFDVLTYKTVRTRERACYPLPNLQPVACGPLTGGEGRLLAVDAMRDTWAVAFGMPSKAPDSWRADIAETRRRLPAGKLLSVSVVGTVQPEWTVEHLADDYAQAARWAAESGADAIETNFSCPNVSTRDGQLYQQPADAALVAQRVREAIGEAPLVIKIGHITSTGEMDRLLEALAPYANAVAMTNSVAATVVDGAGRLLFDGQKRGICGAAIFDSSLAQVVLAAEVISRRGLPLEIVGVGGAGNAAQVRQYLDAGAQAVHLATAAMVNPRVALEIRHDMAGQPSSPMGEGGGNS